MYGRDPDAYRARGDVWLGDFWWAIAKTTVGTAEERRQWALELLDLPLEAAEAADEASPVEAGTDNVGSATSVSQSTEALRHAPFRAAPPAALAQEAFPYGIVSEQRDSDGSAGLTWLEAAEPLPGVSDSQLTARPKLQPLFRPQTTRALLSTALATQRPEGDIDVERIIENACRLRPLTALPRRSLATLRFGIQLLIDRGAGMELFRDDQQRLAAEIRDVVGRDRAEILYFADSPLRGCGPRGPHSWRRYEPPSAGTPAVLLTDLGIARLRHPGIGASPDEWLAFARRLRGAECPVLALTPYGPKRWPATLTRALSIVPWDRATSVSLVRRLMGHGLEVARRA